MSSIHLTLVIIVVGIGLLALLLFGLARVLKQWSKGKPPVKFTISMEIGEPTMIPRKRLPSSVRSRTRET